MRQRLSGSYYTSISCWIIFSCASTWETDNWRLVYHPPTGLGLAWTGMKPACEDWKDGKFVGLFKTEMSCPPLLTLVPGVELLGCKTNPEDLQKNASVNSIYDYIDSKLILNINYIVTYHVSVLGEGYTKDFWYIEAAAAAAWSLFWCLLIFSSPAALPFWSWSGVLSEFAPENNHNFQNGTLICENIAGR